jgi:hypothetical protein
MLCKFLPYLSRPIFPIPYFFLIQSRVSTVFDILFLTMSSRFLFPVLSLILSLSAQTVFSQVTVWQENFSGGNQGWSQNFTDCDGTVGSFAGVQNGRFEVIDMEGTPCCASGGGNENEWVTNAIAIDEYCSVSISATYGFVGTFECVAGGPYFGCSNDVSIDNGHDQMVFEYSIDGGAWVQFAYICGGQTGTATATNLTGNSISIRIRPSNKAVAETYWFDNVTVSGVPQPTVNPVNDVSVCAGLPVNVAFSGTGTPPPSYAWTNDNTAIGLGASGNGNINFTTPAGLSSPETATITVTPTSAGCVGEPETFTISVNPPPTVNDPANITVCPSDVLNVMFDGSSPTATYNWTASLPLPGGNASGTGDINFQVPPVIPFPITATVTVTASENGCTGSPQTFTVSGFPEPSGNMTLTSSSNLCQGQNAVFSVGITNGNAPFTFIYALDGVNQPPVTANTSPFTLNLPLMNSATVSLESVTASNTCDGDGNGSANITVNPAPTATLASGSSSICTGEEANLEIDLDGNGPFTFVYRINGINQPPVNTSDLNYTLSVSPPNAGTYNYTLSSVTSNGCTGTTSGSYALTVNQSPTATLTGNATICTGQSALLTITFSGTAPYTVNYTANGVPQTPITTSNNPYTFFVTPTEDPTIYELVDVTDGDGCLGTVQGIATVNLNDSPTALLTSDTLALCSGGSDTLQFSFTGPSPYTFVYSVNGANQPSITTSSSTYSLIVTPTSTSTYTLVSVTGGGCSGAVFGTYMITVGSPPTATISGDTTICPGTQASLVIDFTGTAPFTFVYKINGLDQPPITTSNDPYILNVSPISITAYGLDSVASNGCPGTVSGLATVNTAPSVSATISGGGQICTGGTGTEIYINFVGVGPYTFVYSANNVPVDTITTSTNPYVIPVNPPNGTTYRLVSVTNGTCSGMVSGTAIVSVFVPANAVLSGDQTFCDSANTTVMIDFAGTGPFTIVYTIDGVVQPPDTTEDDPYLIPIITNTTTEIELISVESPGCIGIPNGTATITINYAPSYTNLDLNCNASAGTYTVEFDVLGATLPLTVVSGGGSFSGTHFTSPPIAIGTPYNFVFHDANDCSDVTVSGPSTCNCLTEAGTMNLTPLEVCVGQTATATHNGNFFNDGDDILRFILHTNPALPVGTILGWNTTPSFTFGPGMTAGTTYYISAIAGNNDGSGNVDLNDLCVSVSQGTPVTFFPLPTADLGLGDTICVGNQAIIPVTLTGLAPFSLTWTLNGVPQTVGNIPNSNYQIAVQPIANAVVALVSISDSRCTATVTDTAYIGVNTPPQVSNLMVDCDAPTQTYVVSFNLAGTPPFIFGGVAVIDNGGNQFETVPIPSTSPYQITIADANMCGQTILADSTDCACTTNAGTMSQTQVTVCENATLTVSATTGQDLDADDQLLYILHTNPANPPGVILAWNTTPQFTFQPGMMTNTTYYVSAIAGNPGGAGQIDLNDPCLSIAVGTPVQFQLQPTATISPSDTSICAGKEVTFTVNFTGTAPFSFEYSVGGTAQPPVTGINTNSYSFTNVYSQNTVIHLNSVSDQNCQNVPVQDSAVITIDGIPNITNVQTVCDPTGQFYAVNFTIVGGEAPYNVTGPGLTGDVIGNQFFSDTIFPSGAPYSINLNDANVCGVTFIVGSFSCNCTTAAGTLSQTALTLCAGETATIPAATGSVLDGNDTLLYVLVSTTNPLTWTVLATSNTPSFNFNPGTMTSNTTYHIVAVAGNSTGSGVLLSDPCLSIAAGPTVTWRAPVTATISGPASVCAGAPATLTVQFSGAGPFSFIYNNGTQQTVNNISQNPYSLSVTPVNNAGAITLVSVTGAGGCAGSVSGSVAVSTAPQALNIQAICDLNTQTYTLQFDISNGAAPNSTYTVTGVDGDLTDTTFVSDPIDGNLPYSVTITDATGCSVSIAGESDCVCDSDAGTLTAVEANGCLPDGEVSVQVGGQTLDPDDVLQYILYQDPLQLPLGIIAVSNTPQFTFQTGMTAGTTYYISAIAGNNDGTGGVDTSDACLSISPGIPVTFHEPPTATLSGTASFCAGGNASFQIQFTGTAPFTFVYAINNNPQPAITAPGTTFSITTNSVQQDQTFTLISVEDAYCSGSVSGEATVDIIDPPTASLIGVPTICAGDTVSLGLVLTGGTSYDVTISGGATPIQLTGVQNGALVNVGPTSTTTYTITSVTAAGNACPAVIGESATVEVSDIDALSNVSDYNGFGVSCPNETDGFINISPTGGIEPITANWSNGATGLQLNNLAPGSYAVTLTDQASCIWVDSFELIAPPGLAIQTSSIQPTCFGDNDGSITIESVLGGADPFTLTLNGLTYQTTDTFPTTINLLEAGDYLLEVADANGCVTDESVNVPAPPQITVNLGADVTVSFGDSLILEALLNTTTYDTFAWTPTDYLQTPDSLVTLVRPPRSQIYTFTIVDTIGCQFSDEVRVVVQKGSRVYLPNIIKPASNILNDRFTVFAGAEVAKVRFMRIYDRWGSLLFENQNFTPNDPQFGWDGRARGDEVNPGVYVYVVEVEYFDGTTEVFSGDVTVVR